MGKEAVNDNNAGIDPRQSLLAKRKGARIKKRQKILPLPPTKDQKSIISQNQRNNLAENIKSIRDKISSARTKEDFAAIALQNYK